MHEEEIRKINRLAVARVKTLISSAKKLEEFLDGTESETSDPRFHTMDGMEVQDFWSKLWYRIGQLQYYYENIALMIPMHQRNRIIKDMSEPFRIAVKSMDGMLLIRVPHPPLRSAKYYQGNQLILSTMIADEVNNVEHLFEKRIWLLHVYTEKESKRKLSRRLAPKQ